MIYMFGGLHGGAAVGAPHGGAGTGVPLGGAAAGVHGVHMNPNYITRSEFNLFRAIVFNRFQLIINNMQQNRGDINQNMNQVQQMRLDINQIL